MGWKTSLGIVADTHLDELGVGGPTVLFNLIAPGQAGFAQVGRDVVVEPMTMDPCVMSIGARLGRRGPATTRPRTSPCSTNYSAGKPSMD
ncbi:hypothetical protein [Gordonia crocea]|uniref:hypothetical protein n=1 Tax=Gordonia crocea TaxID=589162 RepID=UPI00137ABC11|nr:hypothetical protein [Gordonia crocea]